MFAGEFIAWSSSCTRLSTGDLVTREIAIGDIHGCSTALEALLREIDPTPADTIITLGDYIDRGPDSRGVIEQLMGLRGRCNLIMLLGNHEEMLFGAFDGGSKLDLWLQFGGDEMLRSYADRGGLELVPQEHLRFLRDCRLFVESDTHIFVHAGFWPNRRMDDQPASALLWENLDPERAAPHYSRKPVVLGHTPQTNGEVLDLGFLKCIDTFCHSGGWLTGLEVFSGQVWQTNQQGDFRGLSLGSSQTSRVSPS